VRRQIQLLEDIANKDKSDKSLQEVGGGFTHRI
jgi:hypothetical protein